MYNGLLQKNENMQMRIIPEEERRTAEDAGIKIPSDLTLRNVFGVQVEIPTVGHNSKAAFVEERDWACIIRFPEEVSERAKFFWGGFKECVIRSITVESHAKIPEQGIMTESERFAVLAQPYAEDRINLDFKALLEDLSYIENCGEPLRFELYINGQLVAEADDTIFLNDPNAPTARVFRDWLYAQGISEHTNLALPEYLEAMPAESQESAP